MGTYSIQQRKVMLAKNPPEVMPDLSNPIGNKQDVSDAVSTFGLNKNKPAAKAWIIKRAKQLGAEDALPDSWGVKPATKTAVKHEIDVEDYIRHASFMQNKVSEISNGE